MSGHLARAQTWIIALVTCLILVRGARAQQPTPGADPGLSFSDDFSDHCGWPRGATEAFSYGCQGGFYRMRLKRAGPVHVTRDFRWRARSLSLEVDAAVASGRGTEPGAALFGIGCLVDSDRGYVAILRTSGDWAIMRLENTFTQLAGAAIAGDPRRLGPPTRLRIICAGESGKPSVVTFFVNGQRVGSVEDRDGYATFNGAALYTDTFEGEVAFQRFIAGEPAKEEQTRVQPMPAIPGFSTLRPRLASAVAPQPTDSSFGVPGDTVPVLLHLGPLVYPLHARQVGLQGWVLFDAIISVDGHPEPNSLQLVAMSDSIFVGPAEKALMASRYRPGSRRGVPVRVLVRQPITFTLAN